MRRDAWQNISFIIIFVFTLGAVSQVLAKETPPLAFVTEYIHELKANENARAKAECKLNASKTPRDKMLNAIHSYTLINLDLRSQISALKNMHLPPQFANLIPNIINWYAKKIDCYDQLIKISSIMVAGPQPGVDIKYYGQLSALVPQRRALINYVDETLFKITPMIFMTLIDQKPDSKGQ